MKNWEDNEEIKIFREYLRIPSVHPNIDYVPCVDFLRKLANEIGLNFQVEYPASIEKPVVILSLIGIDPNAPSVLLNSHMDVVPVFEEFWTHKPFDADIDIDGKIFARGAQDMKSVGMQYLGAIRSLMMKQVTMRRTFHVVFVPDEEIFGQAGMKAFVSSGAFKNLNIGFALDEGIASPTDDFHVFYGERTCWHVLFRVNGQPGHGSLLLKATVAEKLRVLLDRIYDYRRTQEEILEKNPELKLGDVTSLNITKIKGGKQRNVLPPVVEVTVDIRIALTENTSEFEKMLRKWAKQAGEGIEIEFLVKEAFVPPTKTDASNIYWKAFKEAIDEMSLKIIPQVFPAGTDAVYLREAGIPALGFSPMNNTPVLLHDHDEYLQADIYLKGIEIYKNILEKIGNSDD